MVPQSSTAPRRDWRRLLTPALFVLVSVGQFAIGAFLLWQHTSQPVRVPLRATAGFWLILVAIAQLRMVYVAWRRGGRHIALETPRGRLLFRWVSVGLVVCYSACLLLGENAAAANIFWISIATWYTATLLLLLARHGLLEKTLALLARRGVRISGWSAYFLLMAPLAAELGLRAVALAGHDTLAEAYLAAELKLVPGSNFGGLSVNREGYWDQEFSRQAEAGVLRVAVVGGDFTLGGDVSTNFLSRIERRMPGVEIYNFGLPGACPCHYAAQLRHEVTAYHPHLVLAVISVSTDITQQAAEPGMFDPRWLHTYRLSSQWLAPSQTSALASLAPVRPAVDYQSYLNRTAQQISVCRTPIDDAMRARWNEVLGHLDSMVEVCNAQNLPLAMVVAPGDFQVNPGLLRVLCRRRGYGQQQVDVDLPQRRLANYAKQRSLRMLDLLPHLRNCEQRSFDGRDHTLSDDGHLVAANVIGGWLESQFASLVATTAQVSR